MKYKGRHFSACLALVVLAITCEAQQMTRVHFKSSPDPDIALSRFDRTEFGKFKKVFELSSNMSIAEPLAFVVSNKTHKAVTGIAVTWTITDRFGFETSYPSFTYSYLLPKSPPLALPNGSVLVTPGAFVPHTAVESTGLVGLVPDEQFLARFLSAAEIEVAIDCIIFADGEIVGDNPSRVISDIRDRKRAADLVIAEVLDARSSGRQVLDTLRATQELPFSLGNGVHRYKSMFTRQLLKARDFDAEFAIIQAIPAAPNFFRKDGAPL